MYSNRFRAHLTQFIHRLLLLLMLFGISSPSLQAETPPDTAPLTTQLTQLLNALQAAEKNIPRDSFEASAVLPSTELTPDSLNTWVQEQTWLIPYNGALRNAQGVLMDRVGNSLDRALLLQTMLRELGYDTRLLQGTLTEAQAKQLLAERRPLPANTLPTSRESPQHSEKLIKDFNLDAAQLAKVKAEAEKNQQQLKNTLQERVERQTAELLKLLGTLPAPKPDESYKALQDHWWVQYQEKDQWFDIDPTLSTELAQHIHPKPLKTYELNKLNQLPSELLHSVKIKVILECASDEKLTEAILTQTPAILPSEVLGKPLSVNHIAVNLPNNFNAGDLNAFKKIILEQEHWFPIITVADQQYFEQEYTPNCVLNKAKPPQTGTTVDNKVSAVADAFGTPEITPSTNLAGNAFITSMWLEYEIHTPNQPKHTIRRQLFDLIGAAQRATGKVDQQLSEEQQLAWRLMLLGNTEILPAAQGLSDDYLNNLSAKQVLKLRESLLYLVNALTTNTAPDPAQSSNTIALPANLYALSSLRQKLAPLNHFTQINILSLHNYLALKNQQIATHQAFDIVNNELVNAPHDFAAQLRQGVIDTNVEALLMEHICRAMEIITCSPIANAANDWAQSKLSDWQVVRDSQSIPSLPFSDDIKQQWQQALDQNQVLIVPKRLLATQTPVNWWRIDSKTGLTLGINQQGWGATTAEYVSLVRTIATSVACGYVAGLKNSPQDAMVCLATSLMGASAWSMGVEGSKLGAQIVLAAADIIKIAYAVNKAGK